MQAVLITIGDEILIGQVVDVPGCGLGATLIARRVLETLDFRGYHGTSCDGWFALDCQAHGFAQKCDTGCVAGHIDGEEWLWPSIEVEGLCAVEALPYGQ